MNTLCSLISVHQGPLPISAINETVEINVVDPVSRKGYRFKGPATIHQHGPIFEQGLAFFRQRGTRSPIHSIVLVRVERAIPLISPAYDQGKGEEEIRASWLQYWSALYGRPEDRGPAGGGRRD